MLQRESFLLKDTRPFFRLISDPDLFFGSNLQVIIYLCYKHITVPSKREFPMRINHPIISNEYRVLLASRGIAPNMFDGAHITLETGNLDDLFPAEMAVPDFNDLKGVIAPTMADLARIIMTAVILDANAYTGVREPWLETIRHHIESVEQAMHAESSAMLR